MYLTNQAVRHQKFGDGIIKNRDGIYLSVEFNCGTKRFLFPDAFSEYLTIEDEGIQVEIEKYLEQTRTERDRIISENSAHSLTPEPNPNERSEHTVSEYDLIEYIEFLYDFCS